MLSLTQSDAFIIGPIAKYILRPIMSLIYNVLDSIGENGIANIGLCIILFTIIMYLLMLPLTIKQQKFSKMSALMNPEIKAIQKKYENKKNDQQAMMKQNEEIQAVYNKYGVSMTGGCLQMLIQLPIMFALYQVIMKIPAYVSNLYTKYEVVVNAVKDNAGAKAKFLEFAEKANIKVTFGEDTRSAVDAMCKFTSNQLNEISEMLNIDRVTDSVNKIIDVNKFIFDGFSLTDSPSQIMSDVMAGGLHGVEIGIFILALAIPILSGLTQFLNSKLLPQNTSSDDNGTMASSMKTMNMVMPIMSVVFCFTFASGLGLYWVMGAVVRSVQQVIINRHFDKLDVDEMIKKNLDKVNAKRAAMGLPPQKISNTAKQNTRSIDNSQDRKKNAQEKAKASSEYYNSTNTAKPGSLKSKANMVKQFNEKNKK